MTAIAITVAQPRGHSSTTLQVSPSVQVNLTAGEHTAVSRRLLVGVPAHVSSNLHQPGAAEIFRSGSQNAADALTLK